MVAARSNVPLFLRYVVIPVARKVWLHTAVSRPASAARRSDICHAVAWGRWPPGGAAARPFARLRGRTSGTRSLGGLPQLGRLQVGDEVLLERVMAWDLVALAAFSWTQPNRLRFVSTVLDAQRRDRADAREAVGMVGSRHGHAIRSVCPCRSNSRAGSLPRR